MIDKRILRKQRLLSREFLEQQRHLSRKLLSMIDKKVLRKTEAFVKKAVVSG